MSYHPPTISRSDTHVDSTGDSGSSLLEYADGKAVCVGIVSYGLGCATKGVPGIYTRTSSFIPWIKDITRNREKATVQFIRLSPPH